MFGCVGKVVALPVRDQALKARESLPGGQGPYCNCTVCLLYLRIFEPNFEPLNMLKNSPKLARTSGRVKDFTKCKN